LIVGGFVLSLVSDRVWILDRDRAALTFPNLTPGRSPKNNQK
jgi:hypothetical protein